MDDSTAEKLFPPTPRRREQARREGRVPRSASLTASIVTLSLLATLRYAGGWFVRQVESTGGRVLEQGAWVSLKDVDPVGELQQTALRGLALLAPWLGVLVLTAAGMQWLQGGWLFLPQRLTEGADRLFSGGTDSAERARRAAWGLLQLVGVVAVAAWRVQTRIGVWSRLATLPLADSLREVATETLDLGLYAVGALALLGVVDYGWNWWRHERSLWMTLDELRQEMQDDAGGKRAPRTTPEPRETTEVASSGFVVQERSSQPA